MVMKLRKYRWSKTYESAEEELERLLQSKNIAAERWTADLGEIFEPHQHPQHKQLWCVEGTVVFTIDGKDISLQAGDALDLPANTVHQAVAGMSGCVCYESPPLSENPSLQGS